MGDGGTGEKTEEATPQREQEARKKGQVAKSQDVLGALSFIVTFSVMALMLTGMLDEFKQFILACIYAGTADGSIPAVVNTGMKALQFSLIMSLPCLGAAFVVGFTGNYLQVGLMFTTEPLMPDIKKLNPIQGFKGLFAKKKIFELIKQLIKFTAVGYVAYDTIGQYTRSIILAQRAPLDNTVRLAGLVLYDIAIKVGGLFIILAAADFFYQRWQHKKDLMMSKYDVKQEYKQSEGDPEMKSHRKQLAEELIMHGSQENVRNADAVITNPAHIAVAIKYDKEKGGAPRIVAKGMNKNAAKIKEIAQQFDVPIMRNVPLAQSLNHLDIGEEIPEDLYNAVAEVLNFVFELQQKKKI